MGQAGVVGILLDKERVLKYDFPALRQLEALLPGGNVILALQARSFTNLSLFLWAGLKHQEKGLTIEAVDRLIGEAQNRGAEGSDFAALWNKVADGLDVGNIFRSPTASTNGAGPS